jgi:hypothetical protein
MTVEITGETIIALVLLGISSVGVAFVMYGSAVRNSWGINTGDVCCPHCGEPLPKSREPQSLRQAWWGGWKCKSCGTEVDKWGRELHSGEGAPRERPPETDRPGEGFGPGSFFFPNRRRPDLWVALFLFVLVNVVYDYYFPRGILFDILMLAAYVIWWLTTL